MATACRWEVLGTRVPEWLFCTALRRSASQFASDQRVSRSEPTRSKPGMRTFFLLSARRSAARGLGTPVENSLRRLVEDLGTVNRTCLMAASCVPGFIATTLTGRPWRSAKTRWVSMLDRETVFLADGAVREGASDVDLRAWMPVGGERASNGLQGGAREPCLCLVEPAAGSFSLTGRGW